MICTWPSAPRLDPFTAKLHTGFPPKMSLTPLPTVPAKAAATSDGRMSLQGSSAEDPAWPAPAVPVTAGGRADPEGDAEREDDGVLEPHAARPHSVLRMATARKERRGTWGTVGGPGGPVKDGCGSRVPRIRAPDPRLLREETGRSSPRRASGNRGTPAGPRGSAPGAGRSCGAGSVGGRGSHLGATIFGSSLFRVGGWPSRGPARRHPRPGGPKGFELIFGTRPP